MSTDIQEFVFAFLKDLHYDTTKITEKTRIGPWGMDLESLAVTELAERVEDEYAVRFEDDELEAIPKMTIGEFADEVDRRRALAARPGGGAA
jgi:acyl carrier protein